MRLPANLGEALASLDDAVPEHKLQHPPAVYERAFDTAVQRVFAARRADWTSWLEANHPEYDPHDPEAEYLFSAEWATDATRRRPELWDASAGFPGGLEDDEYFASGSNHAGEIKALALLGIHPGVAVDALDQGGNAERMLMSLRGKRTKIFVDSGAFGEIDFKATPPCEDRRFAPPCVKVRAGKSLFITDEEWEYRLGIYLRLAKALGPQLYVVAPDMVAHQKETLERLVRWRDVVRAVAETGANVIVPVQKGGMDMPTFFRRELEILGPSPAGWARTRRQYWSRNWRYEGPAGEPPWRVLTGGHATEPSSCWLPGIPSKADATTPEDAFDFIARARPERVHFLGLGRENERHPTYIGGARYIAARLGYVLGITCDSVRITAWVGRDKKTGKAPPYRKITAMRDALLESGWREDDVAALKEEVLRRVFLNEQREKLDAAIAAGWKGGCYGDYDWESVSPGPEEDHSC